MSSELQTEAFPKVRNAAPFTPQNLSLLSCPLLSELCSVCVLAAVDVQLFLAMYRRLFSQCRSVVRSYADQCVEASASAFSLDFGSS